MIIFDKSWNSFARLYLVKGTPVSESDSKKYEERLLDIKATLFESLLLFDGLAFEVYGENIPLAMMLNILGVKQIEALVEQKSIEFVLQRSLITYLIDDIPGINPLQTGILNTGPHADPEESLELGLRWLSQRPDRATVRLLKRKLLPLYRDSLGVSQEAAVNMTYDAYERGELASMGLPVAGRIDELGRDDRAALCSVATDVWETATLAVRGYSSFMDYSKFNIAGASISNLKKAKAIEDGAAKLFQLEGLPDLRSLYKAYPHLMDSLTSIRGKSYSREFRTWIENVSSSGSGEGLSRIYIDSLMKKKGFFQQNQGKLVRSLGVGAIGAGVGAAFAGPPGVVAGLGLGLLDTFLLERFVAGWHPRLFIDDVRKAADQEPFVVV